MKTRTILDNISNMGCSVKTERLNMNTWEIERTRCAYSNSPSGREQLKQDYPNYYEILVATEWGDTPTVSDELPEEIL